VVAPAGSTIDVDPAQPAAPVAFKALVGGAAVDAAWSLDRGELGTIDPATGRFTAKGTLGGTATVTAAYRGRTGSTKITVRLRVTQNGELRQDAGGGSGGQGGVGGEGPGGAVDAAKQAVLRGTPQAMAGLGWVYPYEATVWPRGILAPLLQWSVPSGQNFDAVWIRIAENAFIYEGFFAKPPGASVFQRHPIPQTAWRQLAYSNQGEDVTVTLVFSNGATAYGPITQKWKVAQGTLKGTVYYNSYGTGLARNHGGGIGAFERFGGATLAIRGSSTDPVLVSGYTSANDDGCRVCHSVAANGNRLITQHGAVYGRSMVVSLGGSAAETTMAPADSRFGWPALFPDGTMLFSNAAPMAGSWDQPSKLYAVPGGAEVPGVTGLPSNLKGATPAFSNDGRKVAFNYRAGAGADGRSLAVMDFDPATKAFSNLQVVYTPTAGMAVWPSFLPNNDAVVFEVETVYNGRDFAGTRATCDDVEACRNSGARGELWWVHLATKNARRLDRANGVGHVPRGPNAHDADETLQYEPTVSPVPSGGYAWVVLTTRRLYGNVATINPFWSDPRFHDLSTTPTPKKLWVTAVDLNAQPGTDPSHPAFYLPAQELLAGNSRGYWVVDPCRATGTSCETGDECCGGFCRAAGDGGALVCSDQKPVCAQEFERCAVDADCCPSPGSALRCVNGRCASPGPR